MTLIFIYISITKNKNLLNLFQPFNNLSALQIEHPNAISYPFGLCGIPKGHLSPPRQGFSILGLIFLWQGSQ